MSTTMTSKRPRRDAGTVDAHTIIHIPETYDDAVTAIRRFMNEFGIDPAILEDDGSGLTIFSVWNLVC